MPRTFIVLLACLLLCGCSSPEKRAQKLFNEGKYEEVIAQYPDLPIAKIARDSIAAKEEVEHHKYEQILASCPGPDTLAIDPEARRMAERMFLAGHYDSVLNKYQNTPAASQVRIALAETLYAEKQIDRLIAKYPNTPAGWKARNEVATAEYARISQLSGRKKTAALDNFLRNPRFAGTDAYAKALLDAQNHPR
jgi:uncharacterized protein YcfL